MTISSFKTTFIGTLIFCMAVFLSNAMDAASKFLTNDYSVLQIIWLRYAVYSAVIIFVARPSGIARAVKSDRKGALLLISLFQMAAGLLYVAAFSVLPLVEVQAVAVAGPFIATVMAGLILNERVSAIRWFAVLGGATGVLLALQPHFAVIHWLVILPVLAAACGASIAVLMRSLAVDGEQSLTVLIYSSIFTLITLVAAMPWLWRMPSAPDTALFLLAGVLCVLRDTARISAYQRIEASLAQPFNYTTLLWSAAFGFVIFGDVPSRITMVAMGIIVGFGLLVMVEERLRHVRAASQRGASRYD